MQCVELIDVYLKDYKIARLQDCKIARLQDYKILSCKKIASFTFWALSESRKLKIEN